MPVTGRRPLVHPSDQWKSTVVRIDTAERYLRALMRGRRPQAYTAAMQKAIGTCQ